MRISIPVTDIHDALTRAVEAVRPDPLSVARYRTWRDNTAPNAPSVDVAIRTYGSWAKAVQAAGGYTDRRGVTSVDGPHPDEVARRRDEALNAVRAVAADLESAPTRAAYDSWRLDHPDSGLPSSSTIVMTRSASPSQE